MLINLAPLTPELGGSQMAINLADALRTFGVDVVVWTPAVSRGSWYPPIDAWRKEVERFVAQKGPFDIIDTPAFLVTSGLASQATVVARSVQPQLLYEWIDIKSCRIRTPLSALRMIRKFFASLYVTSRLLSGWSVAHKILCLGTLEKEWMIKKFKNWEGKMYSYMNALSREDQTALARVRINRQRRGEDGLRFLWIGRWVDHKGIRLLVEFLQQRLVTCPNDSITIAGCSSGPYRYIPHGLLSDRRITLLPRYQRSELPQLLDRHDIGLFTSEVEGWGLSLNEMLESGMPVYATDTGGVRDLRPLMHSALRPFPPPEVIPDRVFPSTINWDSYYRKFSWDSIAKQYLDDFAKQSDHEEG